MKILRGLCVSGGDVKGNVFVLSNDVRNVKIEKNTVLVMEKLDRELLVNLNKNVVGVIAEKGNLGSHGAGILRQLHIPCIVRVKSATQYFRNGDKVKICGNSSEIIFMDEDRGDIPNKEIVDKEVKFSYATIEKENFNLEDIRPVLTWEKPRPGRVYQKLRFDIISDVYGSSAKYLYNLDNAKTRQDQMGVLETYGTPNLFDLCSFVLCHPEWLIEKAQERSAEFSSIKESMRGMLTYTNFEDFDSLVFVFKKSVELYRRIFKYLYLAQVTSDELIDIYLDFIKQLTHEEVSKDIFCLRSIYVENCLKSKVDPGGFQSWGDENIIFPHIWDGEIDYTPFPINHDIIGAIEEKGEQNGTLMRNYNSFRQIIPLIYQLSEEFFYIAKSINSFLNWSILEIHRYATEVNAKMSINDLYNTSLNDIYVKINSIKGGFKNMDYSFMSAFHPTETLVKEFKYWLILVRENQLTLGDCYFVLKREIPSFSEMNEEEGAELSIVMNWYENKCRDLYGAEKFNYVAAMMRDNFVHFHAFPRYSKDVERFEVTWKDEFWPGLVKFGPSICDEKYYQMIKDDLSK